MNGIPLLILLGGVAACFLLPILPAKLAADRGYPERKTYLFGLAVAALLVLGPKLLLGMPAVAITIPLGVLVSFVLPLLPARIAALKGRSGLGFYLFGLCCFLPALIVALIIQEMPRQPVNGEA